MTHDEPRDRLASQTSLRHAIEGLDAAPAQVLARPRAPSRLEQRLGSLRASMTPLRLIAVLVGLTIVVLASALAAT